MTEFELIESFFTKDRSQRKDVLLGIGDDAALLKVPAKQSLVVSTDTLLSGVHFPEKTAPFDIGFKALAVNLSDLAAMGATPAWATLALTLPRANEKWLKEFSRGFFTLINRYGMQLVGGDTTRGSLAITVQVLGFVPVNKALQRKQARVEDKIYVTGTLGDAGLALKLLGSSKLKKSAYLLQRFNRPEPRVETGQALCGVSRCAIDISDGLAADLGHILRASGVGAHVFVENLPLSSVLKNNLTKPEAWSLALNSGDDYELCFTVSPSQEPKLKKVLGKIKCPYTWIGTVEKKPGLRLKYPQGCAANIALKGYRHF